jgi:hypothetical protein
MMHYTSWVNRANGAGFVYMHFEMLTEKGNRAPKPNSGLQIGENEDGGWRTWGHRVPSGSAFGSGTRIYCRTSCLTPG